VAGNVNDGQELYAVQDIGDGKVATLGKLNIKLNNSGNGFDVMQFENGLENTTKVRLFESKPMNNNSVVLPRTSMGTQMGNDWIDANILKMINSHDNNVANIGNILRQNQLERYVFTVDKDLKQVIIFKLDNFQ
jgi:hypothetical protein